MSRMRPGFGCKRTEQGMTLIEMIIGISMLTVIAAPLTSAAILFAQHGAEVDKSISDDGSIRAVAALFVADAQSARSVMVDDSTACGSTNDAAASFRWNESGQSITSSWFVETINDELVLVRRRCSGAALIGYQRVAEIAAAPKISCFPDCEAPTAVTIVGNAANGAVFSFSGERRTT